ncbi:hypothetical protein LUZ61_021137 [Rhynchospora tenuis]|uniref:Protein kinase domain-containing protein n=1 Tax=Rhynchospora tenuis TaxID=198213 RepID=A0AAD5WB91_9POAL|nr:hypothetical protein LUZ61_021137 [Rhynchospora tenuis]
MTLANDNEALYDEIIASATTDYLQVCLINKGRGTPFISALELRQLNRNMYPDANSTLSLLTFVRLNLGLSDISLTRYPNDIYDRFWTNYTDVTWKNIYTDSIVKPDRDFETPSVVMQTAAITSSPKQSLNISWHSNDNSTEFIAILHIGEIQNIPSTDMREFDILINGILVANDIVPIKLSGGIVIYGIRSFTSYKISLKATSNSTLPPLLNGFELYIVVPLKGVPTDGGDDNRSKVPKSNESVRTNPAENNHEKNYANTPEANTQGINAGPNNGDGPKHNIAGDGMWDFENRRFSYDDLIRITNKFQIKIGTGGFGNVYVGALENGTQVAVKLRSQSSRQGVREFLTEAQNLTRVHHKNLVSLLGYCMDGDHMALVYEYMPEGNLQDKLKGEDYFYTERPLTWKQRLRIAYESAQGLEYLHMACNPPLIHRDVKTNNILLNKNLEAKLADFGLSKAFDKDGSSNIPFSTRVVGTLGYLDPE